MKLIDDRAVNGWYIRHNSHMAFSRGHGTYFLFLHVLDSRYHAIYSSSIVGDLEILEKKGQVEARKSEKMA